LTNLDEALERFHLADLEYGGGLANHGPMGVQALEDLGHQALIPAFLDLYVPRLPPAEPGAPIADRDAEAARGRIERRADWVASFEARLEEGDWRTLLSAELPGLMPGLFAGAGHGFLRTVHAVRMLEAQDTPLRRRELARGLAYWAARYQRLPGEPAAHAKPGRGLASFFRDLVLVAEPEAREGFFFETVRRLDAVPEFAAAIEAMPCPADDEIDAFLQELRRRAATLYCAHPQARIAYVHALTLPTALRDVLGLLDANSGQRGRAALYVLQAVAALHAVYGETRATAWEPSALDDEVRETAKSWDEVRYRAACSIQAHAIKMTEACLRCDRLDPEPIFALAAADAALRIEGGRGSAHC
jgi:hypothetical protein